MIFMKTILRTHHQSDLPYSISQFLLGSSELILLRTGSGAPTLKAYLCSVYGVFSKLEVTIYTIFYIFLPLANLTQNQNENTVFVIHISNDLYKNLFRNSMVLVYRQHTNRIYRDLVKNSLVI